MKFLLNNIRRPQAWRLITRRDLGLLLFLVLVAVGGWLLITQLPRAESATVHLWDGSSFSIDLGVDQEVFIPGKLGPLRAVVSHRRLWVSSSPCPEQICTNSGSLPDETMAIICVPGGVLIEAEQGGTGYDSLSW